MRIMLVNAVGPIVGDKIGELRRGRRDFLRETGDGFISRQSR